MGSVSSNDCGGRQCDAYQAGIVWAKLPTDMERDNATSRVDCCVILSIGVAPLALAQSDPYVPALADIMSAAQWRHIKLWFAGRHQNWELASYELLQIRAGLEQAATLYHGIPVDYVGATVPPIQAMGAAIEAKDRRGLREGLRRAHGRRQRPSPRDWPGICRHPGSDRLSLQRPVVCSTQEAAVTSAARRAARAGGERRASTPKGRR